MTNNHTFGLLEWILDDVPRWHLDGRPISAGSPCEIVSPKTGMSLPARFESARAGRRLLIVLREIDGFQYERVVATAPDPSNDEDGTTSLWCPSDGPADREDHDRSRPS